MKTNKLMLLSAIIFGLLAAYGVYWYLDNMEKRLDQTEYGQVIVPKETIQVNTRVTKDMFQSKRLPVAYIHPNAIIDPEEIENAINKAILVADEPLLRDKLVKKGQLGEGLAYQISEGYRALTIPINQVSGLAGLVKPGDSVDIIVTIDTNEVISTYVLQDILVLAADNILERKESGANALERKSLTLEVTPNDAPRLVLASEEGNLRLLLRSPADSNKPWVPAANIKGFN